MTGWSLILFLASGFLTLHVEAQGTYVLSPENIVRNGSFELEPFGLPPPYWTGSLGLGTGIPGAADGRNVAVFTTTNEYAAQTLLTTAGQAYHLSFAVSGNSKFRAIEIMQVSWGDSVVGNTTWVSPYTPESGLNFDWVYGNFDVVATSSSTVLSFQQDPASTRGVIFFDAVQVVPIPEPLSLSTLVAGTLALVIVLCPRAKSPQN